MEFISPHKYIKNTSTNGIILTEQMLNISRWLQSPKRKRKIPWQAGRKKKRGIRKGAVPLARCWRWGKVPTLSKTPLRWGNQLGQKGTFPGIEGQCTQSPDGPRKAGLSKNCTYGLCHGPAHPSWVMCLLLLRMVGCWKVEAKSFTWGALRVHTVLLVSLCCSYSHLNDSSSKCQLHKLQLQLGTNVHS